jgi:hypothetical protein
MLNITFYVPEHAISKERPDKVPIELRRDFTRAVGDVMKADGRLKGAKFYLIVVPSEEYGLENYVITAFAGHDEFKGVMDDVANDAIYKAWYSVYGNDVFIGGKKGNKGKRPGKAKANPREAA